MRALRIAQQEAFSEGYLALQRRKELVNTRKVLPLQLWLDKEGQMRSHGRLKYEEFLDTRFRKNSTSQAKFFFITIQGRGFQRQKR